MLTAIRGVVRRGQVAGAELEATAPPQDALPVATAMLLTEHASAAVVKLAVNALDAPCARLAVVNTLVLVSTVTTTLVRSTAPELITQPLRVILLPGLDWEPGHERVTRMLGMTESGQSPVIEFDTVRPVHLLIPVATMVSVTEQTF